MNPEFEHLYQALTKVDGFIYPNEIELSWSVLIVLYPFITGLVAGAFILASLERVFNVKSLKPTYVIALLTAFSFMLVATMPLPSGGAKSKAPMFRFHRTADQEIMLTNRKRLHQREL